MVELGRDAHAAGEVEMADPEHVDAVDLGDLVDIGDAVHGLDQADEAGAPVGGGERCVDRAHPVAVVGQRQRHAALAAGRVLHLLDDGPGLVRRAHHRG
jgi:hypothetical protein